MIEYKVMNDNVQLSGLGGVGYESYNMTLWYSTPLWELKF